MDNSQRESGTNEERTYSDLNAGTEARFHEAGRQDEAAAEHEVEGGRRGIGY
jgi:hypothetical protein